jgi:CRP-like cAMP-binding protein
VARSDGSYICIRAEELREMCQKDHDLGYQLMYQLARALRNRLQDARTQLAGLS